MPRQLRIEYEGAVYHYQTFEVKYNGQPVDVSTRLVHEVRVINSEVVRKVWVDQP